jgi:TetR/AcrR family acrAB operon transcriptional repressor
MALATAPSTKERLVAAAIEVFRRDGYEGARVQDIAREAGLTTGAIYANYRGKAELLSEAIGERTARELEALLREGAGQTPRELLSVLADRLIRRDAERPLFLEAVVASARDPELAAMLRAAVSDRESRFGALVERAKRSGEIDPNVDTDVMARFCVMLAFGAIVLRTFDVPSRDRDDWHSFIDRLLGALAPQSS